MKFHSSWTKISGHNTRRKGQRRGDQAKYREIDDGDFEYRGSLMSAGGCPAPNNEHWDFAVLHRSAASQGSRRVGVNGTKEDRKRPDTPVSLAYPPT